MVSDRKPGTQGKKTPKDQVHFIVMMGRQGWSAQDTADALADKFGESARGLRTVQNILKASIDNQMPWDRLRTPGTDVRLIFNVLTEVIRVSEGRKQELTQEEADWVAWVCHAAPSLPLYYVWVVACLYMAETRLSKQFTQLDVFLAFKPWESLEAMKAFDDMCENGLITDSKVMVEVAAGARNAVYHREDNPETQSDLLDGAYRVISATTTDEMLTPPEEQAGGDSRANRQGQEQQVELQARGFPIDEDHAALGMVYTHEQQEHEDQEAEFWTAVEEYKRRANEST